MTSDPQKSLLPDRHPTQDFFVADIMDGISLKDDMASMSYPFFSLSKKRDLRNLEYQNGDVRITVKPNTDGLPTIFDKDVLLYCGSLLMKEINEGRVPTRTLRISARDLLVATNRRTGGDSYAYLKKALDRLRGVTVKTNIKTNNREITSAFGFIDSYEIIESSRIKDRMVRLEITLAEWFYNSILGKEVLTIDRNYFRLGKPLERRLYEIARKHCGRNAEWTIGLGNLKERTGSTSSLTKFRYFMQQQMRFNHLPNYSIEITKRDIVVFRRRTATPKISFNDMPCIKPETLQLGERITRDAGTGWNYQDLVHQFDVQLVRGFAPNSVDGAFIGFVKKKVAHPP